MNPKVSVVVPSYNVAPYIGQCLDSILEQTLREIEVIVVDAYSTDGTREIINEYIQKDGRVSLIDDIKKSTGYSKNIVIDMARAPYYAIVESDDYIEKDMFEKMYDVAERTGVDFVKAGFSTFLEANGNRFDFPKSVAAKKTDYNCIINPKEYPECFKWIMFEWLGLYRVSFLRDNKIRHNESAGAAFQDTGFWFLSFSYAQKVYLMKDYFYHYRCDNPYASVKDPRKSLNICNEYEYIYKELSCDADRWEMIKSQFCRGFIYDNYVVFNRIDDELKPALVKKVRETLKKIYDNSINRKLFDEKELELLDRILYSEEIFLQEETLLENKRKNAQKTLENAIKGRTNIIIYGAGSYGANLHYYLQTKGVEIKAYADSDPNKAGTTLNGRSILSISQIKENYKKPIYLIANRLHSTEIHDYLISCEVDESDVIVCDIEMIVKNLI